jgi:hypothetical protein
MNTLPKIRGNHLAAVLSRVAQADPGLKLPPSTPQPDPQHLVDVQVVTADQGQTAEQIFDQLRWGGQVIFASADRRKAAQFATQLAQSGFELTQNPTWLAHGPLGLTIPFVWPRTHYLVARKVQLVPPGQITERFTYHVHLSRGGTADEYVVIKEVPTLEMVTARLRSKWPQLADEIIEKRARKFSDKIFPIFLTREAAILKIVNRDIPEIYRDRIPRLLELERDERGYARRLSLSWLRNGGEPLSQLEFARQSADLLRVLHDQVGVMHLDLRLDNFVITPKGVGFVDFGSAVRADENLKESPLLNNLFEELMRTSEIQRMLLSMTRTGQVTSQAISSGLHKVDKAVDYFYLAVQINSPHSNPDLKDLILYDKQSSEAKMLSKLTEQILRPPDPANPPFRSAADILGGIEQVEKELRGEQRATA